MGIIEKDKQYIANTYSRFPIVLTEGKGSLVYDENGKEYIDLSSGIAVNTFGYCDDLWLAAVKKQAASLQHTSNLYYSAPCVELAEMLCKKTGMERVFFSNSGAEANECAIKTARKWAAAKKGTEYFNIITLENSFHGRTITTLSATGQAVFHNDFLPLTNGFLYSSPEDATGLEKLLVENKCAAIMIEIVQGEGGVVPLSAEYVNKIFSLAAKYDVLVICDEVQTGNGRTGKLYSYINYGVTPDIVTTAKGLAGGLPLGATLLGKKTANVLGIGSHGSTFGGNPVATAGAISVLKRLDDTLFAEVIRKSEYIKSELEKCNGVESVTGLGLMLGVKTKKDASAVISKCIEKGVLVIKAKDKLRLLPALNIPDELLKKAITILCEVCSTAPNNEKDDMAQ